MNTSAVTINEVLIPCSLGWMETIHGGTEPRNQNVLHCRLYFFLPSWGEALIPLVEVDFLSASTQLFWLTSSAGMWRSSTKFFLTVFTQSTCLHSRLLREQKGVEITALWCHRALKLLPTLKTYQGIRA